MLMHPNQAFSLSCHRKKPPSTQLSTSSTPTQFGLKILVDPSLSSESSSSPPLNIIFVHGLGGSPEGTWTDTQSKAFWPPWLSRVKGLENARIMTFGYDAGWNKIWKPNNVLDISDFASQLVNQLWCHYEEYGNVNFFLYPVFSDPEGPNAIRCS